jgi:hypothetical protein
MGQIEEILALLGGRSILRERVAKARKMLKFSLIAGHDCRLLLQAGKVALLGRAWGAYEAWGLRICNFSETREPSGKRGADRRANCHETVTEVLDFEPTSTALAFRTSWGCFDSPSSISSETIRPAYRCNQQRRFVVITRSAYLMRMTRFALHVWLTTFFRVIGSGSHHLDRLWLLPWYIPPRF